MSRTLARTVTLFVVPAVLGIGVWVLLGTSGDLAALQEERARGAPDETTRAALTTTGSRAREVPVPREGPAALRFRVELTPEAAAGIRDLGLEPSTAGSGFDGRVYVIVSRQGEPEPREQTGLTGVPLWGRDVEAFGPGDPARLADGEAGIVGYPLERIGDLPPDTYWVQAFLNVYTTFRRADGHTVRMHLNSGAGQSPFEAPGNAHGEPVQLRLDPAEDREVVLALDRVIPPVEPPGPDGVLQQGNPPARERVRFLKIRSEVLSEFWGRDMYIGANVLLPAGWDEDPAARYPAIWLQGHFPGRSAPFGYGEGRRSRSADFTGFWDSDDAPRMIAVTIRDANPYYDTSYGVNSANVGPYGDAIHRELMPYLEERFRMVPESWARVTAGGSTGGWEALAAQVFHPDTYGGAWGWCPDPVDFSYYQIVDVYEDDNAYWTEYDWVRVERPNARRPDGNIRSTVRMENLYELAVGPNSRSAGQWAIWEAVFGPVGGDGYPAPIWDKRTGAIDRDVAEYWRENYDLNAILQDNWSELGPQLRGKLHVATGDMDTYYLEQAVYLLEDFLSTVQDPPADASFEYGRRRPHCWIGASPADPSEDLTYAEFVRIAADHVRSNAPAGADLDWYR